MRLTNASAGWLSAVLLIGCNSENQQEQALSAETQSSNARTMSEYCEEELSKIKVAIDWPEVNDPRLHAKIGTPAVIQKRIHDATASGEHWTLSDFWISKGTGTRATFFFPEDEGKPALIGFSDPTNSCHMTVRTSDLRRAVVDLPPELCTQTRIVVMNKLVKKPDQFKAWLLSNQTDVNQIGDQLRDFLRTQPWDATADDVSGSSDYALLEAVKLRNIIGDNHPCSSLLGKNVIRPERIHE